MKKFAAILLLGIFSFNIFGYKIVAYLIESRQNARIEKALDKNDYDDASLISIKQKTNLPYYNNSAEFQRIDGEIVINGVYYKYVKCRIYNDSLELLCIPNASKMSIQKSKIEFSKMMADAQQNDAKKKSQSDSKSFHKYISDFEEMQTSNAFNVDYSKINLYNKQVVFKSSLFSRSPEQPPDQQG